MFVRFRESKNRLRVSLVASHRVGGKVHHEHIAMLGTLKASLPIAERLIFWQRLHERMASLSNRVDAETQAKLLGDIHARVPMVTSHEQRALQLDDVNEVSKASAMTL